MKVIGESQLAASNLASAPRSTAWPPPSLSRGYSLLRSRSRQPLRVGRPLVRTPHTSEISALVCSAYSGQPLRNFAAFLFPRCTDTGTDLRFRDPHSRFKLLFVEAVAGRRMGGQTRNIEGRNVLAKMQKTLGPLGVLHGYMEDRTRVKVYTRNARGIRGHVEAYVAAFDKHWNLALEDCFEVWSRKVKRKAPALGGAQCLARTLEDSAPKVVVRKIEGKRETLERHVPQMLLRGEQVAIIVKIN